MYNLKSNLFSSMRHSMAGTLATVAVLSAASVPCMAAAKSAAFGAAVADNVTTQSGDDTFVPGITGLDDLSGLTEAKLREQAVNTGIFPNDMNKIFFLYNVKTGKFLNSGGYWGTHVSLKDYPLPFWVNINGTLIEFEQEMNTDVGRYLGWKGDIDMSNPDDGLFIDRSTSDNTHYGWTFEAVDDDTKNTYRLYTYATNKPSVSSDKQLYLCANGGVTDQDMNCGAITSDRITEQGLKGYDEWRVMSMQQIYDLQSQNTDNMTSSLDLSFKLQCPGFSRGRSDIDHWKTNLFSTSGNVRYGLEHAYNKSAKVSGDTYDSGDYFKSGGTYTFGGRTYTDQEDYLRYNAKYFCMDVKDARGVIYQDVKVMHGGSYVVECKGYSTTPKAKLFAELYDKNMNKVPNTVYQTVLSQVSYMSKDEQATLHTSEQNMDYAGKSFYGSRKYINSVLVHVPEPSSTDGYYYVRFGVIIGENESDTKVDSSDEWTVFDDFRLLYASGTTDADLILDEDRADLSYLKDCSNIYRNKVLHLKKTFTKDKWNSFVLPVSLTRDQFMQAFGANAKLAKLSKLTDHEIEFETINMDVQDPNAKVLEAYTPYIIFPTKYQDSRESPAYRALLTQTGSSESKTYPVVIAANHIDIPNVTFDTNADNHNDLSNIDTDTWTTKKMYRVTGNGTMEAHGTFARTFGVNASQDINDSSSSYGKFTFNDRNIIPGRDDLKGSFFFDNGNLYISSKRARGLRGFSCWFKPTDSTLSSPKLLLSIDGIAQGGTTGISDVVDFGDDATVGKAAEGIFNLNGQRVSHGFDTTGLPAGVYIVNGKKCVVR